MAVSLRVKAALVGGVLVFSMLLILIFVARGYYEAKKEETERDFQYIQAQKQARKTSQWRRIPISEDMELLASPRQEIKGTDAKVSFMLLPFPNGVEVPSLVFTKALKQLFIFSHVNKISVRMTAWAYPDIDSSVDRTILFVIANDLFPNTEGKFYIVATASDTRWVMDKIASSYYTRLLFEFGDSYTSALSNHYTQIPLGNAKYELEHVRRKQAR